jgi:transposase InsO family protein
MRGLIRGRKPRTTIPVAFAIDLFSRAIVGWSASTTRDVALWSRVCRWRCGVAITPAGQ